MRVPQGLVPLARYVEIAADLAHKIVLEEYQTGQRLFGRSSLAGQYHVSPETIRRALSLLQERGAVEVQPGVGVVVKSKSAAEAFVAEYSQQKAIGEMQERLRSLIEERNRLNEEIDILTDELLNFTFKMASRLQKIQEIRIPENSPLVGQTLASSQFRARTGATILSLKRKGEEMFSPSANTELKGGDLLVIVGPPEAEQQARLLAQGSNSQANEES